MESLAKAACSNTPLGNEGKKKHENPSSDVTPKLCLDSDGKERTRLGGFSIENLPLLSTTSRVSTRLEHGISVVDLVKAVGLPNSVNELRKFTELFSCYSLIKSDETQDLCKYLDTLESTLEGKIPEKLNYPVCFTWKIPASDGIPKADDPELMADIDKACLNPVNFVMIQSDCMLTDMSICGIVSREFATNLYDCISPLSRNIIELGCGRAMLTAAISVVKAGKKGVLLATDINDQKQHGLWNGVSFKAMSAEKVVNHKEYKNNYMNVIYVCMNSELPMLQSLINQSTPLFLLNIGHQWYKQLSQELTSGRLKIVELNISGYDSLRENDSTRLLVINMPDNDCRKKLAKIEEKYKKQKTGVGS